MASNRLRYNNAAGTLGSPALTNVATTITFAVAPAFATIAGTDYIPLVLDPPAGPTPNPNFEIVFITAYTSGATSGTILRGQGGTTAVAHNVGALWAQAPVVTDFQGQVPIGGCVPYSGSGDPPETNWVIADGRLIDAVVYPEFLTRTGHAYNNGVNPGNNGLGHQQVKIPDKRGRHSIGAINMGTGAGANDNNHAQLAIGAKASGTSGEVVHTLSTTEGPSHSHGGAVVGTNLDHQHYVPISWSWSDPSHAHSINDPGHAHAVGNLAPSGNAALILYNPGGLSGHGSYTSPGVGTQGTDGRGTGIGIYGAYTGITATWYNGDANNGYSRFASGAVSNGGASSWVHGHGINADLSGGSHNNLAPYEADSYIVRIA